MNGMKQNYGLSVRLCKIVEIDKCFHGIILSQIRLQIFSTSAVIYFDSELTETAIPMVRVFEARDVDWARPVMASCTIAVVSVALTEICPKIYSVIVTLAEHEWRILAKSLAYKNETTGSAVLAVFTAGMYNIL